MTKPIIGAAMMMLWEEGKWTLDDPVAKHIPEFADLKVKTQGRRSPVAQARPMTMAPADEPYRRLRPPWRVRRRQPARRRPSGHDRRRLAKRPLSFQPGTEWRYGPSVDIQGYVIEKLSGQGLDEFLEQRLFAPLGMVDTGFWVDPSKSARVARIHKYEDGKIVPAGRENAFNTSRPKLPRRRRRAGLHHRGLLAFRPDDPERRRVRRPALSEGRDGRAMMHKSVLEPGVNVTLYSPHARGLGFGMDFAIIEDPVAGEDGAGRPKLLLGRRVRHLVLDRSGQRHDRHRHDPERQRHDAGRRADGARALGARWSTPR